MNPEVPKVNSRAVLVVGLTAFALSIVWYSPALFGGIWRTLGHAHPDAMPAWKTLIAPLRELIAAAALAQLIVRLRIASWQGAAGLGFGLWLAFHAVQMAGAVIWDDMPWKLGAVHAGDWLMKMVFMAVALALWHRAKARQEAGA